MNRFSLSLIVAGSGGAGALSTAGMLLEAAGKLGWHGHMTRSVGAQIRGGEAAAMLRLSVDPIVSHADEFHILLALDWHNLGKYAAEFPLSANSLLIGDPEQGDVPAELLASGAQSAQVALKALAQTIPAGRPNMVALGVLADLLGLSDTAIDAVLDKTFSHKGDKAMNASRAAIQAGRLAAGSLPSGYSLQIPKAIPSGERWLMTGNEATGLGAVRGGIRYVAAYPITPATEVLEWMAPALTRLGGTLVQVEDELAAINQIIGASYGGLPSMTATAGPGLALMTESLGLAVATETPIVVVDVMRGGPSTGIPAKSEQSDLNIALYGLHGDAPHLVLAPNTVADCIFTTQWAVHLAETLQTVALVLSDQSLGQTQVATNQPPCTTFPTQRMVATQPPANGPYQRYALTPSGVSPMALPGTPGCQYTADGLEHNPFGTPSSQASDHQAQMDKRLNKLTQFDYGPAWADVEGDGDTAVLTWGSCTGAAREAVHRRQAQGQRVRLISLRLLFPVLPEQLAKALQGVEQILVVEQTHSGQFMRYLRAFHDLPGQMRLLNRPGPLPIRPKDIETALVDWSNA